MNPDVKQAWLQALRSGEYEQGRGQLRNHGLLCCLGVLCDLHAKATGGEWKPMPDGNQYYLGENEILPTAVSQWAWLDESPRLGEYKAVDLNDGYSKIDLRPHTFAEIADLIEAHL